MRLAATGHNAIRCVLKTLTRDEMRPEFRIATAALVAASIAACSDGPTGTEELAPRRELVAAATAPPAPAGNIALCYTGADGNTVATNCPVLKWNGITYWAFAYVDEGHNSLNLVAYDADEIELNTSERTGTRQLYDITINATDRTVTLLGKDSAPAVVPWSVLELSQPAGQ